MLSPCEPSGALTNVPRKTWRPDLRGGWKASLSAWGRSLWLALRSPEGQRRLAWWLVLLVIVVDILLVGRHALVRYETYRADAFDLGNMDQAVWNTLHGHAFRFTNRGLDWFGPPTRLGVHVEPILFLIAPFYLIHSGPETLIVLQTVALALGALPLFLLVRRRLPALPLVATAFAASYLAAPELLGEAMWDFHPVALATPLILLALWALDARRSGVYWLALVLALMTKEDVGLSFTLLGIVLVLRQQRWRLGSATAVISLGWTLICFLVILPHYNQGVEGGNNFWYRYSWLGDSATDAFHNILANPFLPFTILADPARLGYLALLLRSGGGFGILSPLLWLCALPDLAVNVLSVHAEQYSGFFQYNAVLLPYLVVAAVWGAAALYEVRRAAEHGEAPGEYLPALKHENTATRLVERVARRCISARNAIIWRIPLPARWVGPVIAVGLLLCTVWNFVADTGRLPDFWQAGEVPYAAQGQVDALLARIPTAASVAATDTLDPHLSDRYELYLMPDPLSYNAEYVAADIDHAATGSREPDEAMLDLMLRSGRYSVIGRADHVIVLKRIGEPMVASQEITATGHHVP